MDLDSGSAGTATAEESRRPDVLAFVAPTTIRFLVLLAALLSTGLFLGTWIHNASSAGREWSQRVLECSQRAAAARSDDPLARFRLERQCEASVELRRFSFAVAGAGATSVAGVLVMVLTPSVIQRRRRLRAADARCAPIVERLHQLAGEAGLRRAPTLMVGSSTLRDAFSYGLPGHYRVVLPPAVLVRWRDPLIFEPLVRHELAHVRHHDVPLAWLARSTGLVVLPLLVLPVVGSLVVGDYSLLQSYLWRAALLAAISLIAAAALLRSREYDADLRAAPDPGAAARLGELLAGAPVPRGWRRRFLGYHPTPERRVAILAQPQRHAVVTFSDGLTVAFLAGLAMPLLRSVVSIVSPDRAVAIVALLLGPLLGAAFGLGLWRQSLVRRVVGGSSSVVPATLGALVGAGLGTSASLGQTAAGTWGEYGQLAASLVLPGAMAGATMVTAGVGEVFAAGAGAFRRPRPAWLLGILVAGLLFTAALAGAMTLGLTIDQAGWALARVVVLSTLGGRLPAMASLALAVLIGLLLLAARHHPRLPSWAVRGDAPSAPPGPPRPGLLAAATVGWAAGGVGAVVIVGMRLLSGPAATDLEKIARADLGTWVMAAAGAGAVLACVALQPRRGLGVGLLASPVASLTAAAGFLALNTALGGHLTLGFAELVARPGLALGLTATLAGGALSLLLQWRGDRKAPPTLVLVGLGALLAGLVSLAAVAGRDVLVPSGDPSAPAPVVPREFYRAVVARPLLDGRQAEAEAVRALQAEHPSNVVAAERIRAEILPLLRQMRDGAAEVRLDDPDVERVHVHAVAGARLHVAGFTLIAAALEADDARGLQEGNELLRRGNVEWERWASGVERL